MSRARNNAGRLEARIDQLANQVRFWRVTAIVLSCMLSAICLNTYVFGGAA